MRRVIFWTHLAAGLIAGSIVLVMAVTGVLLAFEQQIVEWAERDVRCPPEAGSARLAPEALLGKVVSSQSGRTPSGLTLRSGADEPARVSFGRDVTLLVNPYTGAALGEGAKQLRAFFHSVTDWHRWLAREGESRATGKAITGACNLAFLVLIVSGFYLWWPRKWTPGAFAAVAVPRLRLTGKARDFNWHNSIGFWCAPALLFIVLTGVLMTYPWATNLLYRATGSEPPPQQPPRAQGGESNRALSTSGLDRMWTRAEQQVPDWKLISVRFAPSATAPVPFMIDRGPRGRPDLRIMLTLDPQTADIVKSESFSSYGTARQLRMWARWVHTGEAAGLLGQCIASLASAGAVFLVWTGGALSWRRFFGRNRRAGEKNGGTLSPLAVDRS